jgi:hypothetical protein
MFPDSFLQETSLVAWRSRKKLVSRTTKTEEYCHTFQFIEGKWVFRKILHTWQHLWFRFFTAWPRTELAEKQTTSADLPHNPHPLLHSVILPAFVHNSQVKEQSVSSHSPYGFVSAMNSFPFANKCYVEITNLNDLEKESDSFHSERASCIMTISPTINFDLIFFLLYNGTRKETKWIE